MKLIAPQFVKPYVKSNKNDANDAEAICEAMSRPRMRFVSVKTVAQQDIQTTHRIREELKAHRNATANQIRSLVAGYGLVAPKTLLVLRRALKKMAPIIAPTKPADWPRDAKASMRKLLRAKGGLREATYAQLLGEHDYFRTVLRTSCRRADA